MATLVGNGNAASEGMRGMVCGVLFGVTSPIVGHPFDSIKTRMQADLAYARGSAWKTFRLIVQREGFLALYRGLTAPLIGSSIFRSIQFSAYAFAMGAQRDWTSEIPGTGGIQYRVLTSGLVSSTARALIETPLEFIKVRRQMGYSWMKAPTVSQALKNPFAEIAHAYQGFGVTWARTWGLMGTFFVMIDNLERHAPNLLSIPYIGPFLKGGICSTVAWLLVWPFEVIKNQVQAGSKQFDNNAPVLRQMTNTLASPGGFRGLYRGIGPGLLRSIVANGSSMVVYNECRVRMDVS